MTNEFIYCKYNNISEIIPVVPEDLVMNIDDFYITGKKFDFFFLFRLCFNFFFKFIFLVQQHFKFDSDQHFYWNDINPAIILTYFQKCCLKIQNMLKQLDFKLMRIVSTGT